MVARLAKHCHILCRSDDLIRSDEQGYYLREWITVRDAVDSPQRRVISGDKSEATFAAAGNDVTCAPHATGSKPTADEGSQLNERQLWLLAELRSSTAMRRSDFERRFNIHARTAKRDLADLNQRGLIEFIGDGREGFYRLRRSAAV